MAEPAHIYILPCSARKSKDVEKGLNWEDKTEIGPWCKAWEEAEKTPVSELYTGQSFKQSLEAIRAGPKPWRIYVVSAGGGLIRGPTSEDTPEQDIPSYEVHCFPTKPMSPARMGKFWREGKYPDCEKGTWSKMDVKSGDKVVVCLANSYQRAVLNDDFVSHLPKDVDVNIMGSLNVKLYREFNTHGHEKTMRETLGCSFIMLRATILCRWIKRTLPKARKSKKRKTRRVDDKELMALVRKAPVELRATISGMVKHIRHTLNIAASYERIRVCVLKLR